MKKEDGITAPSPLTVMKINFFNSHSPLFPFRWFIIIALVLTGWMTYANLTGWRVLTFSNQQQWNASGPGGHK